jgi:hypothetical protein
MINVTLSIEPAAAFCRFIEHTVAAWIRRPIGDAVQHDVNINTGTQRFVEAFAAGAINYFFNQEIGSLGVFAMKECGGNPNFIGDFDFGKYLGFHKSSL